MQEENHQNAKEQAGSSDHKSDVSQLISDNDMFYLHICLNTVARIILAFVGVVTNLINIIIFSKLGLKDSFSVGLFSLALTDLLASSFHLSSCICYIIGSLCPLISTESRYIDFYVIGWAYSTVYEISCWITVMVSLERCYCVVSPFKVKQAFTSYRCMIMTLIIYVIHIAIHIPVYTINRLEWIEIVTSSANNMTIEAPERTFKININEDVNGLELILDLTAGVSMWLLSQALVIVCAILMGHSLEASSKIRLHTSNESQWTSRSPRSLHSKHSSLSKRERRLVNVVLFLAITLTFCNVPKLICITMYYIFPVGNSHNQRNLEYVMWTLASMFGSLGCSSSIVVYLKLNTSYRRLFESVIFSMIPGRIPFNRYT